MTLSVGIDRHPESWKICMMEDGQTVELCSFADSSLALVYIERTCLLYPELTMTVSLRIDVPFIPLSTLTDQQLEGMANPDQQSEMEHFLKVARSINLNSYILPSVKYLPAVPLYRKFMRANLGSSSDVCAAAALLFRLREREAAWPDMRFLSLSISHHLASVQAIEEGYIVNGMEIMHIDLAQVKKELDGHMQQLSEQAFWEELTQGLAGLMAIHHCEDIVVRGPSQEAFSERFADTYQVYLFPYNASDNAGYEAALGAAVIAEGLYRAGYAAGVVERLQIREASGLPLAPGAI